MPYRSTRIDKPGSTDAPPVDTVVLAHDEDRKSVV
jgi:hypothetical protein